MLNNKSIAALLILLLISSCKKQIADNVFFKNNNGKIDNKWAEKKDIFYPVSQEEAKRFVHTTLETHSEKTNALRKKLDLVNASMQDFGAIVRQNEAKLSDIPIPLNSKPLREFFDYASLDKKIIFGYENFAEPSEIVTFYKAQMERLGWKSIAFFNGLETLMVFKKPSKFCSISIRRCSCQSMIEQEHTNIIIFTQV